MINQVLFGVIGLLLFSVAGIGVSAAVTHPEETAQLVPKAIETVASATQEAVHTVAKVALREDASLEDDSTSADDSGVTGDTDSVVQTNASATASLEKQSSGNHKEDDDDGDDDEHEDEDDDDDWRGTTSTQTNATQTTQTTTPGPTNTGATTNTAPSVQTYTMADVAAHSSAASCYTVVSGSVYNLTSFVTQHPGGQSAIKSLCGVDGTAAFNAQHSGQGAPASELASLKIGVLAQ